MQDCGAVESCDEQLDCRNSIEKKGLHFGECRHCRFAQANGGTQNFYRPVSSMVPKLHPVDREEKRQAKAGRAATKLAARRGKSKLRQHMAKQAERAERGTEREIIQATVNSGRRDQNLDHISRDRILLDSKNQSQRIHPVVDLAELDKARRQAVAAGYPVGGLVLINQFGRRVVVFDIADYAKVVR